MCEGVLQEQGKNTFTHMLKISINKNEVNYQLSRGADSDNEHKKNKEKPKIRTLFGIS